MRTCVWGEGVGGKVRSMVQEAPELQSRNYYTRPYGYSLTDTPMEEQQTYQSKKELRQQENEKERRGARQKRLMRRVRNYGIAALIIVGIVYGFYLLARSSTPQGADLSRSVPLMEATHIAEGSPLPEYTSNPPTSGPHYGQTARSGFREDSIPDQNIIHNLEHGDVWIAYHPRIADGIKEGLRQFAAAKVIITPREANDEDIALVAWGRLDAFDIENDVLPEQRISDFIRHYLSKGPERVPGASGGI